MATIPLSPWSWAQAKEAIRKTLTPSEWISYLPEATPFTTPSLGVATPTKVLIPTTTKFIRDFAIVDIGGGDLRVQYQGSETRRFRIGMTSGTTSSVNNTLLGLRLRHGTVASPDTVEPGVYIPRKIGTGTDVGALGIEGAVELAPLDVIAVEVESSLGGTVTFVGTSIVITENI